jgi:hypothetical protein
MPSVVNVDNNNICNLVMENCAPCDVTLEWDDVLGIMEIEEEELIPLTEDLISSVCQDIDSAFRFPKVKRKRLSREDIQKRCHPQSNQCSSRGVQQNNEKVLAILSQRYNAKLGNLPASTGTQL